MKTFYLFKFIIALGDFERFACVPAGSLKEVVFVWAIGFCFEVCRVFVLR